MKNVKKVNNDKQKNINEIIGENIVNLLHINNISIHLLLIYIYIIALTNH